MCVFAYVCLRVCVERERDKYFEWGGKGEKYGGNWTLPLVRFYVARVFYSPISVQF